MQKEITIAGLPFTISQPYLAGHAITEAEAKALNQVRAENIRNNMASKIKDGSAGAAEVSAYDTAYEFTLASVGGGKRSSDPTEVEALKIARGLFADWAAGKKLTVKAIKEKIGDDAYDAKIAEIAERADTVKEAKRRVKSRQESAEAAMGDMDLGELDLAPATEGTEGVDEAVQ